MDPDGRPVFVEREDARRPGALLGQEVGGDGVEGSPLVDVELVGPQSVGQLLLPPGHRLDDLFELGAVVRGFGKEMMKAILDGL